MARVALVTDGTRGIGEAYSIALANSGCAAAANYAGNDAQLMTKLRSVFDKAGSANIGNASGIIDAAFERL